MDNAQVVEFREKLDSLLAAKNLIELSVRGNKGVELEANLRKLVCGVTQGEPFTSLMCDIRKFDGRYDAVLARCQEAQKQYEAAVQVLPEINRQRKEQHHAKIVANKGNKIDLDPILDLTGIDLWRSIFLPKAE